MSTPPRFSGVVRFGPFEADPQAGSLRKNGIRTKLQELPFRLLCILLERPREIVLRQELRERLWPADTFVDFEHGLNTAIKKLREALDDDAEKPRYIETIPKRGYRFIGELERAASAASAAIPSAAAIGGSASGPAAVAKPAHNRGMIWISLAATLLIVGSGAATWLMFGRPAFSFRSRDSVLVSDFENETGDARFDQALETAFTVSLEQSQHANVFPRDRLGYVLGLMGKPENTVITPELGREICEREGIRGLIASSITRTGKEYELSAELIDPQTGATVRSYSERADGEDHILDALDEISREIRADLGESLYKIHSSNQKLPEVTTSSLAALKDFADGNALWHEGKYDEALTLYRAAVEADPDFAMAHAALGNALCSYIYNEQPKGEEEYQKALTLSSRTTERERMLIQAHYADDMGHVAEADRLYRNYLAVYPDDWDALSDYSRMLRTHGRAADAIAQYQRILQVAPDDARTYVEMGTAYHSLGKLPESLQAYERAFQIDPGLLATGNVEREYGFTLVENGQVAKAEQVFTSLLANPKTREWGLRSLAILDMYDGSYTSAQRRLQECLTLDETGKATLSVARVHLWLAYVAEGEGNKQEIDRQMDAAMENFKGLGPKVEFGALFGQEYARNGMVPKAEHIEETVAPLADTHNAEQMSYLHLLQGEIAVAKDQAAKAIPLLALSDQESRSPLTTEAVAHAYQQAGQKDKAVAAYETLMSEGDEALSWEPQQRWLAAHDVLAADYLALGEKQKASQALAPLLESWKNADADLLLRKQMLKLREQLLK